MILTPLAPDQLPVVMERFAASLDAATRTVFDRIALPKAAQRARGARAVAHRDAAIELADAFGMGILPGPPARDFSWNGRALRSDTEAYVLLHEVAHFQIASPERRSLIDFGLGPGPETGNRAAAEREARLSGAAREAEEAMASLLGIFWELELDQPGLASFLDQNWLEGAGRPGTAAHFRNVLFQLRNRGLLDTAGKPQFRLGVETAALRPSTTKKAAAGEPPAA